MPEVQYPYKGTTDMELEIEDRMRDQAGAGRGRQGGPTAKELADYDRKMNRGIFTAEMGKPPQDVDGGSAAPKKKVVKKASGGMTASKRGDGIAQRGKTRGKMC
jgi:hypothetical protein